MILDAPGENPRAILDLEGVSEPGRVRAWLASRTLEFEKRVRADPEGTLRESTEDVLGAIREGIENHLREKGVSPSDLEASVRDSPRHSFVDENPAAQEIVRIEGGWASVPRAGVSGRFGRASISFMPENQPWILHLLASPRWLERHRRRLLSPRFRAPVRFMPVAFLAEALDCFGRRLPAGWTVRLVQAPDSAPSIADSWAFDLDRGEAGRVLRKVSSLHGEHAEKGASVEDLVIGVLSSIGCVDRHVSAIKAGGPIELEVDRILPILRNFREVEALSDQTRLLSWPLVGDVVVTLAKAIKTPGQISWLGLSEELIAPTVHRPDTLLQMALANATQAFRAGFGDSGPRDPWAGARDERTWTYVDAQEEQVAFLLTRPGLTWASAFLRPDDLVCFPERGTYLFGPAGATPTDIGSLVRSSRFPISARSFRWSDVEAAVLRLNLLRR